jgi:hypothetical protein
MSRTGLSPWYRRGLALTAVLLVAFFGAAVGSPDTQWDPADAIVNIGSGEIIDGALVIKPDRYGKAFVTVPVRALDLSDYPYVNVEFSDRDSLGRALLLWGSGFGRGQYRQSDLPLGSSRTVKAFMGAVDGWEGEVTMLGLGFFIRPGGDVALKSLSLTRPGPLIWLNRVMGDWLYFRPWMPVDINLHVGKRDFASGYSPVVIFACCFVILALACGLWAARGNRGPGAALGAVGVAMLVNWIVLDLFWQLRLVRQNWVTINTFSEKNSEQKLLASQDANVVKFAARVKGEIGSQDDTRVFLAGARDDLTMLTAYYIAPLNTYWHRGGPELPAADWLNPGDFVLLVRPTTISYDAQDEVLSLNGSDVPVVPVLSDPMGWLLRVRQ